MKPRPRRRTPKPRPRKPRWGLYWVTTDDHDEDWFIVATQPGSAARFHERKEGYRRGEAHAELIARVPRSLKPSARGAHYPEREFLEGCGAQILRWETPHTVQIGDLVFVEGLLQHEISTLTDDMAEQQGQGRPNGTQRRGPPS